MSLPDMPTALRSRPFGPRTRERMQLSALDRIDELDYQGVDPELLASYGRLASVLAWVVESFDEVCAERDHWRGEAFAGRADAVLARRDLEDLLAVTAEPSWPTPNNIS